MLKRAVTLTPSISRVIDRAVAAERQRCVQAVEEEPETITVTPLFIERMTPLIVEQLDETVQMIVRDIKRNIRKRIEARA